VARTAVGLDEIKDRVARNLSERRIAEGDGETGRLTLVLRKGVTRTFRAHWTGFKLLYPRNTLLLRAELKDGSLWAEGYISTDQPSWVLAFRKTPPKARGSGGPRPDDKFTHQEHVDEALAHRRQMVEGGLIPDEELIRMEDYDDPIEAADGFFNYASFYVLKAVDASWDQFGYSIDPSVAWDRDEQHAAAVPIDAAIDEGLKKSDILWLTPNTAPERPIPCWFVYREGRAYVLSGERQQVIPDANRVRDAHVVTRWKMRDARLAEFDAAIRQIDARNPKEFEEIAQLLLAKRQSVTGTPEENIGRWMRECVILELTPRV
jgi:hypothetical protein